jgi:hypothetical protein
MQYSVQEKSGLVGSAVRSQYNLLKEHPVGKPNFNFQKRQKELAKKKKTEEKRQRKLDKNTTKPAEDASQPTEGGEAKTENVG